MITIGTAKAPPGSTLRRATRQDRETLRRVRRAAGLWAMLPGGVDRTLASPAAGATWLLEVHATPAGYLTVRWDTVAGKARVEELVIVPAHRGHGLGSWALDVANTACRAMGIRELCIEVEQVIAVLTEGASDAGAPGVPRPRPLPRPVGRTAEATWGPLAARMPAAG